MVGRRPVRVAWQPTRDACARRKCARNGNMTIREMLNVRVAGAAPRHGWLAERERERRSTQSWRFFLSAVAAPAQAVSERLRARSMAFLR